eukprot:scaffold113145_cov18-Tisochrysis_lutea.AAC.1
MQENPPLCRASSMRCAVSVSCSAGVKNSGVARLTSRRVVRTQAKTGDSGARCFCCSHQRFSHSSANTKGAWRPAGMYTGAHVGWVGHCNHRHLGNKQLGKQQGGPQ